MLRVKLRVQNSQCSFAIDNHIEEIDIYYDYEGVEKWCTGAWKANKSGTISYKQFYDEIKKSVKVSFNKVKGHSGDKYNDVARPDSQKTLWELNKLFLQQCKNRQAN